jgi:hypothetical protein
LHQDIRLCLCLRDNSVIEQERKILLRFGDKYFFPYLDDPFTPGDIITIQDPKNEKSKEVADFDYLKNNLPFVPPEKLEPDIKENETINRVMEEMSVKRQAKEELKEEETKLKKKQKL